MMKILSTRTSHLKRPRRPLRHASACHLHRCGRGGFWFTVCSFPRPRRGRCRATRGDRGARCSYAFLTTEHRCRPRRPLRHAARATSPAAAGEAFGLRHAASPRPRRGKCRATRGDRGARCSYAFLTIKTDIVQGAPSVTLRVPPPPLRQGRLLVYGMQLPPSEAGEVPSNARR